MLIPLPLSLSSLHFLNNSQQIHLSIYKIYTPYTSSHKLVSTAPATSPQTPKLIATAMNQKYQLELHQKIKFDLLTNN